MSQGCSNAPVVGVAAAVVVAFAAAEAAVAGDNAAAAGALEALVLENQRNH